ncbi:hypothetical protein FHW03_004250 [Ochrobactrum sp. RH2CCR150]|nr:hypothetical protein [Ochrobactrum sp. RH2CCR150]
MTVHKEKQSVSGDALIRTVLSIRQIQLRRLSLEFVHTSNATDFWRNLALCPILGGSVERNKHYSEDQYLRRERSSALKTLALRVKQS